MNRKAVRNEALPEGWREVRLGEVCNVITSPVDKKTVEGELSVKLCNYTDVYYNNTIDSKIDFMTATAKPREIEKFSLVKGDVIVTKDSETPNDIGVPAYVKETIDNLLCGYHLTVLRPKEQAIGKYICYALTSPRVTYDFYRFANGITRFGLTNESYQKIKIPLPSLPEQKAIASLLEKWDTAIKKTEALIAVKELQLDTLYQNYFRPGSPENKNWDSRRIGKFLSVRKERSVPTKKMPLHSLTIEDGVTAKTDRYNREFLVKNQEAKTYKVVYPKDIVFNPSNLRWGAIAPSEVPTKVVLSPIYEVLEVNDDLIDHDFLTHAVTCPRQIAIFATKVEGTLIERMAVKVDAFRLCKILVPQSMEEQKRVSKILNTAKREIKILRALTEKYYTQKRGLMQKLLTGKWRIY